MTHRPIRPIAICVFSHQDRILVQVAHDSVKGRSYCRPLGGEIEFGEPSDQTVIREIREELDTEVTGLRHVGTLENSFLHEGVPGHEIVQVYDGHFADPSLYARPSIRGTESDGTPFEAQWRRLDEFSPDLPLYPGRLLELLLSRRRGMKPFPSSSAATQP